MAGEERATTSPVIGELLQAPRQFSFYQVVRLLERSVPGAAGIGDLGPAAREAVRLRPNPSMGFAASDVREIEAAPRPSGDAAGEGAEDGAGPGYRVTVNFLSLYGAGSPLPAFYTEEIVSRDEEADSRRDFFDLFHHRYLSFLYRAWEKYRYHLSYRPGASDRLSRWLRGLIGLAQDPRAEASTEQAVEHPERLVSSIGLLLLHSRSAATFAKVLAHYLGGLPVTIEQFIRRDVRIVDSQRALLGRANSTLGQDCTLGRTVPDIGGKFRIRIGPLGFDDFRDMLPDGDGYRRLRRVVPYLLRDQLDHDLELTLRGPEIPVLDLSKDCPARLGWSSWLGTPPGHDSAVRLDL